MEKFTAVVGQSLLRKTDRLFNADASVIWAELLQNARRAGAAEVSVSLLETADGAVEVTFHDDGDGLDDPGVLLHLAESHWGDDVQQAEDPAGMGFFCLSDFAKVNARSRYWSVDIGAKVFSGEEYAHPETRTEKTDGLRLSWVWTGQTFAILSATLQSVAKHSGMRAVKIFGRKGDTELLEQTVASEDYLAGCVGVRSVEELGVRLGILEDVTYSKRYMYGVATPAVRANFYGIKLEVPEGAAIDRLHCVGVCVRVDITHTKILQMVLPARNDIKRNAAFDLLRWHCEKALYEYVKTRMAFHELPHGVYYRALTEFGVDIGPASMTALKTFCDLDGDSNVARVRRDLATDALAATLRDGRLSIHARICAGNEGRSCPELKLLRGDGDYAGYSWYNAIKELVDVYVRIDGGARVAWEEFMEDTTHSHTIVDSIELTMSFSDGTAFSFNVAALATGDTGSSQWDFVDDAHIFLTRAELHNPERIGHMADVITERLFDFSEELGDDEEECSDKFRDEVVSWLWELAGNSRQAFMYTLTQAMKDLNYTMQGAPIVWTAHYDARLKDPDRPGQPAPARILSMQTVECEPTHHKRLVFWPNNVETIEELTSAEEITEARAATYLEAVCGYRGKFNLGEAAPVKVWDLDAIMASVR